MVDILLVEDATFYRTVIKSQLETQFGYNVTAVESYQEAVAAVSNGDINFDLALLGRTLPDAPNGEVIDVIAGMTIPSIIFSATFSESLRDLLAHPHIIDYVVKDSPTSISYILNTIHRYIKNATCTALVVDDSQLAVQQMTALLNKFNFNVISATNSRDALKLFFNTPGIQLVICDYNMPTIDGVDLCKQIRSQKSREQVCLIGVSAYGNQAVSAQFLKAGANDFLTKPFLNEEFFCRITMNMDALDKVRELDELVYTDMITQLKNRRYLEKIYPKFCEDAKKLNLPISCAFFELDSFRDFNDTHGTDAGDALLFMIAREFEEDLNQTMPLVVRYGGSQFCVLYSGEETDSFLAEIERLHHHINQKGFAFEGTTLYFSMTAALCQLNIGQSDDILTKTRKTLDGPNVRPGEIITVR